jgi:hypothetical protein
MMTGKLNIGLHHLGALIEFADIVRGRTRVQFHHEVFPLCTFVSFVVLAFELH